MASISKKQTVCGLHKCAIVQPTGCLQLTVSADYNYRSADTGLFAETDNKQSEESADNTVLLGKQQYWGLHPKTPDEAKVQMTLLNEAVLCRQTAPAGIASATQQSQLHTAGENIHLVSGSHTDISAGQSLTAHAVESLNLFTQSSGIKVQANQGAVTVQAQNDELQLNAL